MRCDQHRHVAGTGHRNSFVRTLWAAEQDTVGWHSKLIHGGHRTDMRAAACAGPGNSSACARTSCRAEGVAVRMSLEQPSGVGASGAVDRKSDPERQVEIDDGRVVVLMQEGGKADRDGGDLALLNAV